MDYQFPKQLDSGLMLDCSVAGKEILNSMIFVGGSTICSTKQPFYSTLGVFIAGIDVGVSAGHAVAQPIDENSEVEYNEGVKVQVLIVFF